MPESLSLMLCGQLEAHLNPGDDPTLWRAALGCIVPIGVELAERQDSKQAIIFEIGSCGHWIRPHWRTRAGTAWPFGYNRTVSSGFVFHAIPELDWSLRWRYNPQRGEFRLTRGQPTRRPLVYRVTLPARTLRHAQATVHTIWTPGSPCQPDHKRVAIFGFKRVGNSWKQWRRMMVEH